LVPLKLGSGAWPVSFLPLPHPKRNQAWPQSPSRTAISPGTPRRKSRRRCRDQTSHNRASRSPSRSRPFRTPASPATLRQTLAGDPRRAGPAPISSWIATHCLRFANLRKVGTSKRGRLGVFRFDLLVGYLEMRAEALVSLIPSASTRVPAVAHRRSAPGSSLLRAHRGSRQHACPKVESLRQLD
jgi:hypothetical protein